MHDLTFFSAHDDHKSLLACMHVSCRIDELTAKRIRTNAAFMKNLSSEYAPPQPYATFSCVIIVVPGSCYACVGKHVVATFSGSDKRSDERSCCC